MLSGFAGRSKEEQIKLIENGYPQKSGSLLLLTALGMFILLPLVFTSFSYTIEVQYGFMTVFLLGGIIYPSKYEVPEKRKRSYWLSSILTFVVIGFISVIMYLGYKPNKFIVKEETVQITGMYGDRWKKEDIQQVTLSKRCQKSSQRKMDLVWLSFQKVILKFLPMEVACYLFKNHLPIF